MSGPSIRGVFVPNLGTVVTLLNYTFVAERLGRRVRVLVDHRERLIFLDRDVAKYGVPNIIRPLLDNGYSISPQVKSQEELATLTSMYLAADAVLLTQKTLQQAIGNDSEVLNLMLSGVEDATTHSTDTS